MTEIRRNGEKWFVLWCCSVASLLVPNSVAADPVQVTGGFINLYADLSSSGLSLSGPGLSINVVADMHAGLGINTITVGQTQAFEFDVMPGGFGTATVPGFTTESGEFVAFQGNLHFVTGPVFVADPMTLFATFSMPFTVTGTISGVPRFSPGASPLFTTAVFGSGTTSLNSFRRFDEEGGPVYHAISATQSIVFADQAPVPEPGTLLLCASGAAAFFARRRRKTARGPVS